MARNEMCLDLRAFINKLEKNSEIIKIEAEVDPYLEIAEIHRRIIAQKGPALLFTNVKGSKFPVATNLFGSAKRLEIAFGSHSQKFVSDMVTAVETIMPPSISKLWSLKHLFSRASKIGIKTISKGPVLEKCQSPPRFTELPLLTSWKSDGGPFVTLPLVYTEHPGGRGHNLGMYRIHRYDDSTTGIHWQIHKGGGYHYHEAELLNQNLPMTLMIGGPPALMIAAIAPLPENIPELMLASLLLEKKINIVRPDKNHHPIVSNAEFAAQGFVPPYKRQPEGPFGDHYGYNSLVHDYPVFHIEQVFHRKDAIYPATIVGRPPQEDFFIGDFLQDLLSPLFPLVMSGVRQLKTFGEAGFHCLAAARVMDRYPREAFCSGLRILGEGQLSLTKFLILTDGNIDVADFPKLWTHILERVDWQKDLFIFANVSQDSLDYTGPTVNKGSKAMLMGLGKQEKRILPEKFKGKIPDEISRHNVFLPGTMVVQGDSYKQKPKLGADLASNPLLSEWPVIILVDNIAEATVSMKEFIWTFFTRFEPAADIYCKEQTLHRFHPGLTPPIVFDCRMKPWYPPVLEVDPETRKKVDEKMPDLVPAKWR
jgi:4-hydroxybenzoate decarboxylase subunit C